MSAVASATASATTPASVTASAPAIAIAVAITSTFTSIPTPPSITTAIIGVLTNFVILLLLDSVIIILSRLVKETIQSIHPTNLAGFPFVINYVCIKSEVTC